MAEKKIDSESWIESVSLVEPSMMFAKNAKIQKESEAKWTRTLRFAAYGTTLGSSLPVGYCVGVINSPSAYISSWCNETLIKRYDIHLSHDALTWLLSSIIAFFLIGAIIGSLIGASLANKYGRRFTFYICGYLLAIAAACFFFCRSLNSVELLLTGRLLSGLAGGINISGLPMYHSEMAVVELRGTLGVFCPIGMTAGVVFGQIFSLQTLFGTAAHWHLALGLYIVPVVLFYAPFKFYPESPKWLYVMRGKHHEAEMELKRLRADISTEAIAAELETMELEANQKNQNSSYCDVLKDSKLILPTFIVCFFHIGQQLSGINALFFYSVSIFRKAGLSQQQASLANLGAGSLNLAVSLLGPWLMKRFNRRPLMLLSTFCCAIFLFLFGLLLYFIDYVSWFSTAIIACMLLYIFFFQFGVGPIPFFIGAELFEVAPRPVAMSLGGLANSAANFFVAMTFPTFQNLIGGLVFIPFSCACLLMFLLTKFYLPETRGRNPTDIAPIMANGFKSKVQKSI